MCRLLTATRGQHDARVDPWLVVSLGESRSWDGGGQWIASLGFWNLPGVRGELLAGRASLYSPPYSRSICVVQRCEAPNLGILARESQAPWEEAVGSLG